MDIYNFHEYPVPTPAERLDLYTKILYRFEVYAFSGGICGKLMIAYVSRFAVPALSTSTMEKVVAAYFPEFMSFKPEGKSMGDYWWDPADIEIRKQVLRECILKITKQQ